MENTGIKTLGKVMYIGGMVALGIILVIGGFTIFPVIEYRGNTIRMFAPERLLGRMPRMDEITRPQEVFHGRVLGEHVLRTEHGEIKLRNRARIEAASNTVSGISAENFRRGRATHSLVVAGIEMPRDISVHFNVRNWRNAPISSMSLDRQEVIISDIPFIAESIVIIAESRLADSPRYTEDISLEVHSFGDITLADGTRISLGTTAEWFGGFLSIYEDEERWRLTRHLGVLRISRGGGFTEYRSVTFEPNWGAFIEGEPR